MVTPSKRLLLLTHNYPRRQGDYAGVFLQSLVQSFATRGIETLVIAPHAAQTERREQHEGIAIRRFRYGPDGFETLAYTGGMHKLAASPLGLFKFCCYLCCNFWSALFARFRFRPTLISAQWIAPSGLVGWLVSILTGKPLYVTSHGTDIVLLQKSGLLRRLAKWVYGRAKKVFVVSSFLKQQILEVGVVTTPEKVQVLPMPARVDVFKPREVEQPEVPLILSVARFTEQKQLTVLFEALAGLAQDGLQFHCQVYGEGALEAEHKRQLADLNLFDHVDLKPPVAQEELAALYAKATVAVLPSINEGFGLTLVEAQLCGTAVVGARSGGITDIIEHEKTGLLFEPGNAAELAGCLKRVLADSAASERLAKQGREAALRRFSPDAIAKRYLEELGL